MFQKYKKIIIIASIVILAFIAVVILRDDSKDAEGDGLLTSTTNTGNTTGGVKQTGASAIGAEIITALSQIKSLNLDNSIFSDPVFIQLKDKSQPIPKEPIGRENPFAPLESIGGERGPQIDFETDVATTTPARTANPPRTGVAN